METAHSKDYHRVQYGGSMWTTEFRMLWRSDELSDRTVVNCSPTPSKESARVKDWSIDWKDWFCCADVAYLPQYFSGLIEESLKDSRHELYIDLIYEQVSFCRGSEFENHRKLGSQLRIFNWRSCKACSMVSWGMRFLRTCFKKAALNPARLP